MDDVRSPFLGAFAKLWKAATSFVLSVGMEQLGSNVTNFREILFLSVFLKYFEKIEVQWESDKNNGYFVWRPLYIYNGILLNIS